MSISSELSRVLTNANWTMYDNGYSDSVQPAGPIPVPNETQLTETPFSSSLLAPWYDMNPQYWSRQNVLEWISFHMEEARCDGGTLDLSHYSIDGAMLCLMTRDTLLDAFGSLGERLHSDLHFHKTKYVDLQLTETCDLLSDFLADFPGFNKSLLSTVVVRSDEGELDYYPEMTPVSDYDFGYESGSTSSDSLNSSNAGGMLSFLNPSSPESGSSDSDPECLDPPQSKFSTGKPFVKTECCEMKKRGRGRPPKISRGSELFLESKKSKHAPRGTHLWEFIRDILVHPEQNPGLMKWEDRSEGVFKFLKSEAVARLWGQKKKNTSMTYEKLSRAMRYYYKREILERVNGRRLVYKFGKNSSGWKQESFGLKVWIHSD